MKHKVDKQLENLLQPLGKLVSLPGNPRQGNVAAIKSSYEEFGQLKPIVGVANDDDTITIVAGNHQLEAVQELEWTHVAVLVAPLSQARAVSFALADNRIQELGYSDPNLLFEMLEDVVQEMPAFWDDLGWDDFEMASMETAAEVHESSAFADGYIPPQITMPDVDKLHYESSPEDAKTIATQGATTVGKEGATARHQYTILFQDAEENGQWYQFLRWLKEQPEADGELTGSQILWFIRENSPVGE